MTSSIDVVALGLALEGALQGVGIAYLFREQVQPALDAGLLVPMLEAWSPPFAGFYLYHASRQYVRPALRAFIDFLRAA
jgi:DNA-binding transcriptional LysR family regulator